MGNLRILADILPIQIQPSRHRGIGQYSAGVLNALLTEPVDDQSYILVGNGHLPKPDPLPISTSVPWRLYYGDYPTDDYSLEEWRKHEKSYAAYWQETLDRFRPDVFHIHSLFEYGHPLHGRYSGFPTIVTVYDLIPLRFKPQYLDRLGYNDIYRYSCDVVSDADHIIAISNDTRNDIVELLGVDEQRVSVAYPGPSRFFDQSFDKTVVDGLRQKHGLDRNFVLSTSGFDFRKNLPRVLKSYSQLPHRLRREYPLVIVCSLLHREEIELRDQAAELGIKDQIILTNYVSYPELLAIYNMATVQFYPSIYEGFGMPVLDAMLAGLPVITSNVSALPEAIGDAGVLVDPTNVDEMTQSLMDVLTSESKRQQMRNDGLERAKMFTWERSAEVFRDVYRKVAPDRGDARDVYPNLMRTPEKISHLALVSPMPPQRSGIADFSFELLKALEKLVDVTAFVDPAVLSDVRQLGALRVDSIRQLPEQVANGKIDAVLYQVGNSSFHHYQLPYIIRIPGVIEMHDGMLQGLTHSWFWPREDTEGYWRELSYTNDQAGREYRRDVRDGLRRPSLYALTANRRIVNHAMGVIVHNSWAAQAVLEHETNVPIRISNLPISLNESAEHLDKKRAREILGIPDDQIILAVFGRITETKRIASILYAFARLVDELPQVRLILVGELDKPRNSFNIPESIKELGLRDVVQVTGYVEEARFLQYIAATDIALNLRYPHAGETSATFIKLLNAGVPTLVSNVGSFIEVPDSCCWKVDVNYMEESMLLVYLRRLILDPALRYQIGQNAMHYVRTQLPDWDRAAEICYEFIHYARRTQQNLLPEWDIPLKGPKGGWSYPERIVPRSLDHRFRRLLGRLWKSH